MVGPLTVLKILHCRKMCSRSQSSSKQKIINGIQLCQKVSNEVVKVDTNNNLCRVCLNQGTIPIHGDSSSRDLTDALTTFGGIMIDISDSYPKYICDSCYALLRSAISFRKLAQESNERLKKAVIPKPGMDDHFRDSPQDNSIGSVNEQKPGVTCKKCDLQFNTILEYNKHRLTYEHKNGFKTCPICENIYSATYFKTHMETHRISSYICDVCGKHFNLKGRFQRHRLTHSYSLPFKCAICPYKGRFSESLKLHMKSHTGEKPFMCELCPQQSLTKSNHNRHMMTHTKKYRFECECGRGFYTRRELEKHLKVDHGGVKEYVCQICGKAFGYRNHMMSHQLKVHNREKLKGGRQPIYLQVESMKQQQNNMT